MTRHIVDVLLLVLLTAVAGEAAGQALRAQADTAQPAALTDGRMHGTVVDEHGDPLSGVVVSAMGMTTVFALTDDVGRFMFRGLPFGPYLVRAHLKGHAPARAREVQVTPTARAVSNFELRAHADEEDASPVLAAGFGAGSDTEEPQAEVSPEDQERAWRLRHLRRSILKDAEPGMVLAGTGDSPEDFTGDMWADMARVVLDMPVRLATALFTDPAATAEINLLTTTSFSQPQDLFSGRAALPRGVAYVALKVPDADALWSIQGAMTQGDLASWVLAGSYASPVDDVHAYEIGLSYSMQRYEGGNQDALASIGDGSRNLGAVHGHDRWALSRNVEVDYGARFARYDYLATTRALLNPRMGITLSPVPDDSLAVRVSVSRDSIAPGAAEFLPPSSGLLLPPERTFSALEPEAGMVPEQVDHVEVGVTREMPGALLVGVRAFRQRVTDQIVTVFGSKGPNARPAVGHYYVGSAGDLDARGLGLSVSSELPVGLTGTVNYMITDATWTRRGEAVAALDGVSAATGEERIHDITTSVAGEVPSTATRVFLVYKLNTGLAAPGGDDHQGMVTRFDLRVNQALPFGFANARWEMLVAVRNLFHDSVTDTSAFDELMVVSPPKQFVGGLTVRF